jgi:hypothetical protein
MNKVLATLALTVGSLVWALFIDASTARADTSDFLSDTQSVGLYNYYGPSAEVALGQQICRQLRYEPRSYVTADLWLYSQLDATQANAFVSIAVTDLCPTV